MELGDAIGEAIAAEAGLEAAWSGAMGAADVPELVDLMGGRNSDLARALVDSGASTSYSSALRNVQRYARGERNPNARTSSALGQIARGAIARGLRGGATITVAGLVRVSEDLRDRSVTIPVSGEHVGPVLAAFRSGDADQLSSAFTEAAYQSTGVPFAWEEVHAAELEQ